MHYIDFQQVNEQGYVRYYQDTFLAADSSTQNLQVTRVHCGDSVNDYLPSGCHRIRGVC